ncbi:MAG: hypothetical protein HGA85_08845 [Nanoarchaeota archaeon]|nr:hypothetical protein [Nanoarchaeota archaeon]
MASVFAHFALASIYYIDPTYFDFYALLVAVMLPDIEYLYIIGKSYLRKEDVKTITKTAFRTGFLHSLIGSFLFAVPITAGIIYLVYNAIGMQFILPDVLHSLIIGVALHLIMDLPAHPYLMLFYPKVIETPFKINFGSRHLRRFYPYKKIEFEPYYYMPYFTWLVWSTVLSCLVLMIIVIF